MENEIFTILFMRIRKEINIMTSKLTKLLFFVAGAAVGSLATYKIVKDKYEKQISEDTLSMVQAFDELRDMYESQPIDNEKNEVDEPVNDVVEEKDNSETKPLPSYAKYGLTEEDFFEGPAEEVEEIVKSEVPKKKVDYTQYYDPNKKNEEKEEEKEVIKPYVITPDEFQDSDYDVESYTYYADDVLTDEFDDIIYEPGETVGTEFADHFGEYEEDAVYIRNDERGIDYEILKDDRTFAELFPDRV